MTARSKTPPRSRELLLAKGLELFSHQGYHGTGLKEILESAGVPKGSFYHYFESKEHFAVEIIDHYRALEFNRWENLFKGSRNDRLSEIHHGLSTLIDEHETREAKLGCLIANLSGELAASSSYFREAIDASTQQVLACIEADFAIAQKQGSLRQDLSPLELAGLFWDAWQGAMLRMQVTRSTAPLRRVVDHLLNHLFKPPA